MRVSADVDPAAVAGWLHREGERLRREFEDVEGWCGRVLASEAGRDAKLCATWLKEAAYERWWDHCEKFAPVVEGWIEAQVEKRQAEERRRIKATFAFGRQPWQAGPEF